MAITFGSGRVGNRDFVELFSRAPQNLGFQLVRNQNLWPFYVFKINPKKKKALLYRFPPQHPEISRKNPLYNDLKTSSDGSGCLIRLQKLKPEIISET